MASQLQPQSQSQSQSQPQSQTQSQSQTQPQTQSKLRALINLIPGESAIGKLGYTAVGGGLATFLISQELYIPNDETLVLVAFALATRALYTRLSGPLSAYLDTSIGEIRAKWLASSISEKDSLAERLADMQLFRDAPAVAAAHFATCQENLTMQAELDSLLATQKFIQAVQFKLDDAVRKEREKAAQERRARVEALVVGVQEALKDPKVQDAILKKCLVDLERMEAKVVA
jgi:F-type H+-transporting ATPase subunit b